MEGSYKEAQNEINIHYGHHPLRVTDEGETMIGVRELDRKLFQHCRDRLHSIKGLYIGAVVGHEGDIRKWGIRISIRKELQMQQFIETKTMSQSDFCDIGNFRGLQESCIFSCLMNCCGQWTFAEV